MLTWNIKRYRLVKQGTGEIKPKINFSTFFIGLCSEKYSLTHPSVSKIITKIVLIFGFPGNKIKLAETWLQRLYRLSHGTSMLKRKFNLANSSLCDIYSCLISYLSQSIWPKFGHIKYWFCVCILRIKSSQHFWSVRPYLTPIYKLKPLGEILVY